VQRADKIFYFLTLRQLIIMLVGGGITYLVFISINESGQVGTIGTTLAFIPLIIATAIAFVKFRGLTLTQLVMTIAEGTQRSQKRHWVARADSPLVSMTKQKEDKSAAKNKRQDEKDIAKQKSARNVKNLAEILDGSL
jgi:hypothetical protein